MATVLVVDDVAENRDLVTMLLTCRGHEVLEARDGNDALDVVRARHPASNWCTACAPTTTRRPPRPR
jgi:CheY-like chemotaxis protein